MDEHKDSNHNDHGWPAAGEGSNRWLALAVIALLAFTVVAFAYGYHQKSLLSQVTTQAASANASVTQMQNQVNALTAKLNEVTAAQAPLPTASPDAASVLSTDVIPQSPETSPAKGPVAKAKRVHPRRHVVRRHAPVDKKYLELQAQLADQQKQLKATQDEVAKDRADLEGSINSTRDNLNGSIAKNHEQLVALEKRGERSYYEFDLSKSKEFERVGPLTLSLRKADTKHKHYNLAMIVDDNELQKKNVNLYEPIWIRSETGSESVQIVVNKIEKNLIHGYISAPKYKPSELAATEGTPNVTPVSVKTPPNPQDPQQPQRPPQQ